MQITHIGKKKEKISQFLTCGFSGSGNYSTKADSTESWSCAYRSSARITDCKIKKKGTL